VIDLPRAPAFAAGRAGVRWPPVVPSFRARAGGRALVFASLVWASPAAGHEPSDVCWDIARTHCTALAACDRLGTQPPSACIRELAARCTHEPESMEPVATCDRPQRTAPTGFGLAVPLGGAAIAAVGLIVWRLSRSWQRRASRGGAERLALALDAALAPVRVLADQARAAAARRGDVMAFVARAQARLRSQQRWELTELAGYLDRAQLAAFAAFAGAYGQYHARLRAALEEHEAAPGRPEPLARILAAGADDADLTSKLTALERLLG
jgi:hypothetical protein